MQLEAVHAVEITKLVEYVERKEDPLIQVVRTHQHNTNSAVLQTARCLKAEVQKETRKMKDSIAEKIKERWHGKRMHGQLPRWWTLNSHIASLNLMTSREKQNVQQWQLKTKQLVQTISRKKF